jgi:hypothetical protein
MKTIDEIADAVHANAVAHGFHDPSQTEYEFLADQLNNLHDEVSELNSARRAGALHLFCDKAHKMRELGMEPLTNMEEEYADILIRTLDQMRRLELDIMKCIIVKHEYNKTRPYKHGKLN